MDDQVDDPGPWEATSHPFNPLIEPPLHEVVPSHFTDSSSDLEEVFVCAVCFELIVMPTTLNCGHTFCRHCLACWFDHGKKIECPSCRQKFVGLPQENIQIKHSLLKLFGDKYNRRQQEILASEENKKVIAEFEAILKKQHEDDELRTATYGCCIGVGLSVFVVVVLSLLPALFREGTGDFSFESLAAQDGSYPLFPEDLVIGADEGVESWSVDNVTSWLEELGLNNYTSSFLNWDVNGRMLLEVEPENLETMFNISNPLHQKVFTKALNTLRLNRVKVPQNLGEFKVVHGGYALFLLYSMSSNPRFTLFYLHMYDRPTYDFYRNTVIGCSSTNTSEAWWFHAGSFVAPHFIVVRFVRCLSEGHFWVGLFLMAQFILRGLIQFITIGRCVRDLNGIDYTDLFVSPMLTMAGFYCVSYIWWLVPNILVDTILLVDIFGAPFLYLSKFYRQLTH